MEETVKKLLESAEFTQKMLACEQPEQVQALFEERGVEISLEEIKAIGVRLRTLLNPAEGELDEDALEDIAGGGVVQVSFPGIVDVTKEITKNAPPSTSWTGKW